MAPEQLEGNRTDASGNQFSFCVSLYEALYGEVPFEGSRSHHAVLERSLGEDSPAAHRPTESRLAPSDAEPRSV